jgi:hypothetical protein
MFKPSDKRTALIRAARQAYPHIHSRIKKYHRAGNWLKNGFFDKWTATSAPDSWTVTTTTATQNTTAPYYRYNQSSLKTATAAGNVKQTNTNNPRLNELAGKNVTFRIKGYTGMASTLRIAIYDGITRTYSDFHDGDSSWDYDDTLKVSATIANEPTQIAFEIYVDAIATTYIADACVTCDSQSIYVGYDGFVSNMPNVVEYTTDFFGQWTRLNDWEVDDEGWLILPSVPAGYLVRTEGYGTLDFLASGVSSTAYTATIAIDQPQLDILIAQAIVLLYTQMSLPNFDTGVSGRYASAIGYWQAELQNRINKFHMPYLPVSKIWRS